MKNRTPYLFLLISCFLAFIACSEDEEPNNMMNNNNDECMEEISYSGDIVTIISNSCALSGCHVAGFENGDFGSYSGVQSRAGSISSRVSARTMPPSGSLSDAQIMAITCWVEQGARDN